MDDINLFAGEEDLFRKCIIFYATISAKEVNKTFDTSAIDSLVFSKIKSEIAGPSDGKTEKAISQGPMLKKSRFA